MEIRPINRTVWPILKVKKLQCIECNHRA